MSEWLLGALGLFFCPYEQRKIGDGLFLLAVVSASAFKHRNLRSQHFVFFPQFDHKISGRIDRSRVYCFCFALVFSRRSGSSAARQSIAVRAPAIQTESEIAVVAQKPEFLFRPSISFQPPIKR